MDGVDFGFEVWIMVNGFLGSGFRLSYFFSFMFNDGVSLLGFGFEVWIMVNVCLRFEFGLSYFLLFMG